MNIRVARFRNKEDIDFGDDRFYGRKYLSTEGQWYYVCWVERARWSQRSRDAMLSKKSNWGRSNKLSFYKCECEDMRYDPEIHDIEVWSRPIRVPPFLNRFSFALKDLRGNAACNFIENIKRMVAQACAMGAGDTLKDGPRYVEAANCVEPLFK